MLAKARHGSTLEKTPTFSGERRSAMPITVGPLGQLQTLCQRDEDLIFSFASSDLVLTPILPNVIRHTWVPTHWRMVTSRVKDTYAVSRRSWPVVPAVAITETPEVVQVQMGEIGI